MIQRVQSIYYGLAALCLLIVTLGVTLFAFELNAADKAQISLEFSSYGIYSDADFTQAPNSNTDILALQQSLDLSAEEKKFEDKAILAFPFYIITVLLTIMVIATILMYKKMPLQVRTGRAAFFFTFLLFIFVSVTYYFGGSEIISMVKTATTTKFLGLGFYLLAAAVALLFLGNLGVKRDIKLIQSLDRLR